MRLILAFGILLSLGACSGLIPQMPEPTPLPVSPPPPPAQPEVKVVTVETQRPAPTVPEVDELNLRDVDWAIITPDNAEAKFAALEGQDAAYFALTAEGYKALSLNLSDLRAQVEQYQQIVGIYKRSYQ